MFGPDPVSRVPGPQDAVELDDAYLSGNPLAHYESRIEGLIAAMDGPGLSSTRGLAQDYLAHLGISVDDIGNVERDERALQVALDAFSLRHHVAETLLRFLVAVVDAAAGRGGTACLWFHASDSPTRLKDVLTRFGALTTRDDAAQVLIELLFPTELRPMVARDPRLTTAMNVMTSWLNRALLLVQRNDINLNGVANKIKHGLATRARDDLRVDLLSETLSNGEPDLRASVLNGPTTYRLFDAIAVETIGRPTTKEACEHTVVMLRPAQLLAEAHMIARVHAAAFHVAAVAHLGDRGAFTPAPYPRLALGPEPPGIHRNAVVGSRRPVTFHTDGSWPTRGRGVANELAFVPITLGEHRKGVVRDA